MLKSSLSTNVRIQFPVVPLFPSTYRLMFLRMWSATLRLEASSTEHISWIWLLRSIAVTLIRESASISSLILRYSHLLMRRKWRRHPKDGVRLLSLQFHSSTSSRTSMFQVPSLMWGTSWVRTLHTIMRIQTTGRVHLLTQITRRLCPAFPATMLSAWIRCLPPVRMPYTWVLTWAHRSVAS